MPNMIVITPDRNAHGNDYKGAFEPESQTFMKVVPGKHTLIQFDASKSMALRQRRVLEALAALEGGNYAGLACFCHGWHAGIQAGVRTKDIPEFVRLICAATKTGTDEKALLYVPLFACWTGGERGFAAKLRDSFCLQGKPWARVYGHTTRGHTTMNAQVRIFEGKGSPIGGFGGEVFVRQPPPKNPLWSVWTAACRGKAPFDKGTMPAPHAWAASARSPAGSMERKHLRFAAPFMTIAELYGVLAPTGVV